MNRGQAAGVLFAALGAVFFAPAGATAADLSREGSVVVRASGAYDDGIGAGTIVARSGTTIRVITAKHVATFGSLVLRFRNGTSAAAHVVTLIAGRDLAIVEADVPLALAQVVRPAPVRSPQSNGFVHVWGSGNDGPAFEPGTIRAVGAELPDGPARGRYALSCRLCHEGDSGGGVFDTNGNLVGIFVGYFTVGAARIPVAELPDTVVVAACERLFTGVTLTVNPASFGSAWKAPRSSTPSVASTSPRRAAAPEKFDTNATLSATLGRSR